MGRNKFLEKLGLTAFSKNIKLKMDNLERSNKEYVDDKSKTKKWAEYQALSEEEKHNGTTYYIPDMPVSTGGEVIGKVERLNGYLSSVATLSTGSVIPFVADSNSNITITNGLVTLKKNKTYNVFCDIRCSFSQADGYAYYALKDANGNEIGMQGMDNSNNRDITNGVHTAISYTITPNEDITIGVYIVKMLGLLNVQNGVSVLTITEIPSLQAMIDVSDEHIEEVTKPIKDIADSSLSKINNHLKNPYIYESVTFDRGAIASDGYLEVTVPYTIPSGYYLVNFMVAHTGHKGVYTFGQYPSGISGDINLKVFFANNETYDMPIATGLIIHVFLAKA